MPSARTTDVKNLTVEEIRILREAVRLMENPNIVAQTLTTTGKPTDSFFGSLALATSADIKTWVNKGIKACLNQAVTPLTKNTRHMPLPDWFSVSFSGLTGGIAGVVGLVAMPFELPLTTYATIKAVAEIAKREGEDLTEQESLLACMEVFSLAGLSQIKGDSERYYRTRATVTRLSNEQAAQKLEVNLADASVMVLIRLMGEAFGRVMLIVTGVTAEMAFPFVAFGVGAGLNMVFMNHFQNVARSHFAIRRLERMYGIETVKRHYLKLANAE